VELKSRVERCKLSISCSYIVEAECPILTISCGYVAMLFSSKSGCNISRKLVLYIVGNFALGIRSNFTYRV
jgi:hypothetical protein